MRPLYIHRCPVSLPRFELLDEYSDMRGHRRRQSVILGESVRVDRKLTFRAAVFSCFTARMTSRAEES
jgi:hypothetical protein